MDLIHIVKKLFDWNTENLVKTASLKKSEIANYFAETFQVKANGRSYTADYDNYFEFLNEFRSTIRSIRYDFHKMIRHQETVVIPLTAHVVRVEGLKEVFEAILILEFNEKGKITLWHEVYVKVGDPL